MIIDEISKMVADKAEIALMAVGTNYDFADLDSLELIELFQEIENRFGVRIPSEDVDQVSSVGDLARYIEERQ